MSHTVDLRSLEPVRDLIGWKKIFVSGLLHFSTPRSKKNRKTSNSQVQKEQRYKNVSDILIVKNITKIIPPDRNIFLMWRLFACVQAPYFHQIHFTINNFQSPLKIISPL